MKKYETIGCCGIDCGLCPRFYTKGDSACPGCGGPGFREKHPSCGFHTCCAVKKDLEVCSYCNEFPCKRFDAEKEGYDSFVTHKMVFTNLGSIKNNGIDKFINNQRQRMNVLGDFLRYFDDGRSKSFYCISCALLPLANLLETHRFALNMEKEPDLKEKCRLVKLHLNDIAGSLNIELKLKNKK